MSYISGAQPGVRPPLGLRNKLVWGTPKINGNGGHYDTNTWTLYHNAD